MNYLGLFSVGAFIGALATIGVQFIAGDEGFALFQKLLITVVAAVFTGAVLAFVKQFRDSKAFGAYGVGLLVSLMWAYTKGALDHIQSPELPLQILGWAHVSASALVSIVAAALFLPPAFRETWRKR